MATAYKCRSCGKEGKDNFYSSAKYQCKVCWNSRTAESGKKQVRILKEEFGGKCSICGYDKCFDALQFHHLDPSSKEFGLGQKRGYSIDKLRQELSKCILVCSNCHCELHSKSRLS